MLACTFIVMFEKMNLEKDIKIVIVDPRDESTVEYEIKGVFPIDSNNMGIYAQIKE